MLQIFTTQLSGRFKNILTKNEDIFENCARALAQACVSEGSIYIHGLGDMTSLGLLAMTGADVLPGVQPLFQDAKMAELDHRDRVLLFIPSLEDEQTMTLIHSIEATGALLIMICAGKRPVDSVSDEHFTLFLQAREPLVPLDDTKKVGIPAAICSAFAYECLYLLTTEILAEYKEEPST